MKAEDILNRFKKMKSDRSTFTNRYQECADYAMSGNANIESERIEGAKRKDTYQTVGENCVIQLASGLYSYMFPTDSAAFVLKIDDEGLAKKDNVKMWLHEVTRLLHVYMIQSNFRSAFFESLKSLVLFGTSCFFCEQGERQPLEFTNFFMGDIYIDVDSKWNVDTVFRAIEYTARQAVQEFGEENLGEKVLAAYKTELRKDEKFHFVHAIYPRPEGKYDLDSEDPLEFRYADIYVCEEDRKIVHEKGYREMPAQVPRFDRNAIEKYGRSPTMKELADLKMLSAMKKVRIKSLEKQCDPPIILPNDGSIWPLATKPGGVIHKMPGAEDPTWFEFKGDLSRLNEAIEQTVQEIKDGYFLSLFELPERNQTMTATEVIQRTEQKMRTLTPIIGRLQSEQFNPMIHRMIGVLSRMKIRRSDGTITNALPEMPPELEGADYNIEYLGKLALVMKTLETQGFVKTMDEMKMLFGELNILDYIDNIDIDRATRDMAINNGVPATWLKNEDVRDEQRRQRQEFQQQQMEMEQMPNMAKAATEAGKAPEKGSIAERMLNAA